jgi:hypothetical protein
LSSSEFSYYFDAEAVSIIVKQLKIKIHFSLFLAIAKIAPIVASAWQ